MKNRAAEKVFSIRGVSQTARCKCTVKTRAYPRNALRTWWFRTSSPAASTWIDFFSVKIMDSLGILKMALIYRWLNYISLQL